MFVAATTRNFGDLPFEEACAQIAELGYDKIEIWLDEESDHLKPSSVAVDPDRFYTSYREMTRLTAVALWLEQDVPAETFSDIAKFSKLMRIAQVTVSSSPLGAPFNSEIERLRNYLQVAGEHGIRLSIKTQVGRLTEDPQTALELCRAVPGLGLTLDPSHFLCGPNRGAPYDEVFPHVYHVHLRDSTAEELQVKVGLGDIDYSRLIAQLKRAGYDSALAVDFSPAPATLDERPLELRKLRMLLETLL